MFFKKSSIKKKCGTVTECNQKIRLVKEIRLVKKKQLFWKFDTTLLN